MKWLVLVLLACIVVGCSSNGKYTYKVEELEKHTVFHITDDVGLTKNSIYGAYNNGDTVWVNMENLRVEPADSTAMMCVIKEQVRK